MKNDTVGDATAKQDQLEALFREHGYNDFKWIDPAKIVVAQWVRMKCIYGCGEYGKNCICPPHTPSVRECREFFREYQRAVTFRFAYKADPPEERHQWSKDVNKGLSDLERAVFLRGHERAFLLLMDGCTICANCADKRANCHNPAVARPTAEAFAMDVYSTVRQYGYPINVLEEKDREMNRYAFLMID